MTLDRLSQEHGQIDALASELLGVVARDQPPEHGLALLRWRLNHILMVHLVREDRMLYPVLRQSGDADAVSRAAAFASEIDALAARFIDYMQRWNSAAVAEDWPGFCAATRAVAQALRDRLRREEHELYPWIADLPDIDEPDPPVRRIDAASG